MKPQMKNRSEKRNAAKYDIRQCCRLHAAHGRTFLLFVFPKLKPGVLVFERRYAKKQKR